MARTVVPYARRGYRTDTSRMADLMAARRDIDINRELAAGDATARMITSLGSIAGDTIGQIMQYQAGEPARREAARVQAEKDRASDVRSFVNDRLSQGVDKGTMADQMRQFGYGIEAEPFAREAKAEQNALVSQTLQSINSRLDVIGKAEEAAAQLLKNPSLYPQLRGPLADYASQLDPTGELARAVPPTITSPAEAQGIFDAVKSASDLARQQQQALRKIEQAQKAAVASVETVGKLTTGIAELVLPHAPEVRATIIENLRDDPGMDLPEHQAVLNSLASMDDAGLRAAIDPKSVGKSNDAPLERQLLDARRAGDRAEEQRILATLRDVGEARRDPSDPSSVLRDERRRIDADAWKDARLREAEADFDKAARPYTEEEEQIPMSVVRAHEARKADIQNAYLQRLGLPPSRVPDRANGVRVSAPAGQPSGDPAFADRPGASPARMADVVMGRTPAPSIAPPPASPLGAGTATAAPARVAPKVGDVVTVRGQKVRITAILPNGQVQGVPVP
jgi:hypothetical protein